jgi:hypothetical protein
MMTPTGYYCSLKGSYRRHLQIIFWMLVSYCPNGKSATPFTNSNVRDSLFLGMHEEQDQNPWETLLEEMAENGHDTQVWEETLHDLASKPIPLNAASREMLESIPFLSEIQVENLSYYLYRYGPMVSLSEILLVEGMDAQTLRWLKPFVCLGKAENFPLSMPPLKKALLFGKQEIRATCGRCIQQKIGYSNETAVSDRYLGDPFQLSLRYGFDYKGKLQFGWVIDKDAGEKFWNPTIKSFDRISAHLLLKDQKHLNTLILGDYRLRFGQGLVCSNDFVMGKSTSVGSLECTGAQLSRHFSSSETNYFRGVAVRFILKPFMQENENLRQHFGLDLTAFASWKKMDATVVNDSFSTILTSGLHRTESEMESRHKLGQKVLGSHLNVRFTQAQCGLTALVWMYDAVPKKSTEVRNVFDNPENQGGNLSMDFRLRWHGFLLFGEAALDQNGNDATLASLTFKPFSRLNLSVLARRYSPKYRATFGNAFAEGSATNNERGVFAAMDCQPFKRVRLSGYYDLFRFPWLSYSVNSPSWGHESCLLMEVSIGRNGRFTLRYKSKTIEKNQLVANEPLSIPSTHQKDQLRMQFSSKQDVWSVKTTLEGNDYTKNGERSYGMVLAQDLGLETGRAFSMQIHFVLFRAENYENRIYLWEKSLPGSFNMPMLYGEGCRFSIYAKYDLNAMSFRLKLGDSLMSGQTTVGEGLEQISGNRRTDILMQYSLRF